MTGHTCCHRSDTHRMYNTGRTLMCPWTSVDKVSLGVYLPHEMLANRGSCVGQGHGELYFLPNFSINLILL